MIKNRYHSNESTTICFPRPFFFSFLGARSRDHADLYGLVAKPLRCEVADWGRPSSTEPRVAPAPFSPAQTSPPPPPPPSILRRVVRRAPRSRAYSACLTEPGRVVSRTGDGGVYRTVELRYETDPSNLACPPATSSVSASNASPTAFDRPQMVLFCFPKPVEITRRGRFPVSPCHTP